MSSTSPGCSPTIIISARLRAFTENRLRRPRMTGRMPGSAAASRNAGARVGPAGIGHWRADFRPPRGVGYPGISHQRLDRPADMLTTSGSSQVGAWPASVPRCAGSPLFPIATARFRRSRRTPARFIALPFSSRPQFVVRHAARGRAASARPARTRLPGRIASTPRRRDSTGTLPGRCRSRRRASRRRPRCSTGNAPSMLDRQVGDAARRVEHARLRRARGRTRLEAQRAGAALIERRRVRLERQAADDLGQEDPRPERRVDHAGVLADPADAGVLRVDALLHRTGVDVGARLERLAATLRASTRAARRAARRSRRGSRRPTRSARSCARSAIGALGRVRAVGVVEGAR